MASAATKANAKKAAAACCAPVGSDRFGDTDAAELATAFAALSDPVRLRIFSIIAAQSDGEAWACDLVEPVGRSQPTVSHHLKVLRDAGLLTSQRRASWVYYAVVPEALAALSGLLKGADVVGVSA